MADNLNPETENLDQQVDWRQGLDETIRNHPSMQNFKNTGDLAKSWVEAQKLIGRDKIPVPGEKATKEDWDTVYERLGRPKDKDGSELPQIKLPEGYPELKPEFVDEFKSKALELGMLPAQVNGIFQWFMESQTAEFNKFGEQRETQRGEAENALRKLWGKAFEQNFAIAEQAVNKYGTDKFVEKLKTTGLSNDPDMIQFIADMAKNFSEDNIAGKPQSFTLSPEEAKEEIRKLQGEAMRDPKHVLNNKHHPEYEYFMEKWHSLHKQAYPDTEPV